MSRTKKKKQNINQILTMLIAVLVVILIVVLCTALIFHSGRADDPDSETGGTSDSASTGGSLNLPDSVTITYPEKNDLLWMEEKLTFTGTSDPRETLTINDIPVERSADGSFSHDVLLKLGANEIVVSHKGQAITYHVERRYVVESFSPAEDQSYNCGATVYFSVSARYGSTVEASFNGETIPLEEDKFQMGSGAAEGFRIYVGEYTLPSNNLSDRDMGVITYTATCDGVTETYTSGTITCLKPAQILASDPGATPDYGDYIDVGSGYIAEIVTFSAETFDGDKVDDYSHPTNNYLPQGTLDYCSTEEVNLGELSYMLLRSGQRVYTQKRNSPTAAIVTVVDCYVGQLPDHNEISVVSLTQSGRHTVLTLDSLWKAPFYFDVLPQTYQAPISSKDRNYSVTAFTATYIEITFCYATEFTGEEKISVDNPLFKSVEVIRNESDTVLRLHLKETGNFYGWDAYYNDQDQLCFQFLNPAVVEEADNAYGADLTGVKIMIDVGHGGSDPGTVRENYKGQDVYESDRNLALALKLQEELESMGATVVLNRSDDRRITVDERIKMLKQEAPDYCVCIHHNSLDVPTFGRFEVFYYTPFSKRAAERIGIRTGETDIYSSSVLNWHNYFLARQTVCPVVLTENGYMSCDSDLDNTLDPEAIAGKARAIAQGIADYFLAINE